MTKTHLDLLLLVNLIWPVHILVSQQVVGSWCTDQLSSSTEVIRIAWSWKSSLRAADKEIDFTIQDLVHWFVKETILAVWDFK